MPTVRTFPLDRYVRIEQLLPAFVARGFDVVVDDGHLVVRPPEARRSARERLTAVTRPLTLITGGAQ